MLLGSIAHSVTTRLMLWVSHVHPSFQLNPGGGFGSPAEFLETIMLVASGLAGVLCGVAIGALIDREPLDETPYAVASQWSPSRTPAAKLSASPHKENIVAISQGRKQAGTIPHITAISENE